MKSTVSRKNNVNTILHGSSEKTAVKFCVHGLGGLAGC